MRSRQKRYGTFNGSLAGTATWTYVGGRTMSLIFLVASLTFLFVHALRPSFVEGARTDISDSFAPLLSAAATPFNAVSNAISEGTGIGDLQAENARLKAENARLKTWYQTALQLEAENKSLGDLLNVKIEPHYRFVTARTISDSGNSFVHSLLVKAGKQDGVGKGQAVINGHGLLGRIIETGRETSRVLLITDLNSRIPVMIENSRIKAVLRGDNSPFPVLALLPDDTELHNGMRILTSGDGGVFPPGLPVGKIVSTEYGVPVIAPFAGTDRAGFVRIVNSQIDPNLQRGVLAQ